MRLRPCVTFVPHASPGPQPDRAAKLAEPPLPAAQAQHERAWRELLGHRYTRALTEPPVDTSSPRVGQIVAGKYHLLGLLGEGGMGEVYLAEHVVLGRKFALKLAPAAAIDASLRSWLSNEAKIGARIQHPSFVDTHDVVEHEGIPGIVTTYVRGINLGGLSKNRALPPDLCVEVGIQLCDALDLVHGAGIVHRDLKPANVMLYRTPFGELRVTLIDPGLAKMEGLSDLAIPGFPIGSPPYMAPEVWRDTTDARSDLYALGVTLFELATGRLPFRGKTWSAIQTKHEYAPIPAIEPHASLSHIVARLLAKNPKDRYQSAPEARRDLARVQAKMPPSE